MSSQKRCLNVLPTRYVLTHGSFQELHDALISLDVDACFLGDMHLSALLLKESITYGEKITDEKNRLLALGTSYNNLGGSLYGTKNFLEAETAIKQALDYWQKYEDIAGTDEFKVVWAYYGIGDVYEQWAKHLHEIGADNTEKKNLSLEAYERSLQLGEERGLSDSNQNHIRERMTAVQAL